MERELCASLRERSSNKPSFLPELKKIKMKMAEKIESSKCACRAVSAVAFLPSSSCITAIHLCFPSSPFCCLSVEHSMPPKSTKARASSAKSVASASTAPAAAVAITCCSSAAAVVLAVAVMALILLVVVVVVALVVLVLLVLVVLLLLLLLVLLLVVVLLLLLLVLLLPPCAGVATAPDDVGVSFVLLFLLRLQNTRWPGHSVFCTQRWSIWRGCRRCTSSLPYRRDRSSRTLASPRLPSCLPSMQTWLRAELIVRDEGNK
jgi:hypothetical protein